MLVLSPEPKYIGETDVDVIYTDNGGILTVGSSNDRAWIQIGQIRLPAGKYTLSGLSGIEKNTLALVLDAYDPAEDRYRRIIQKDAL